MKKRSAGVLLYRLRRGKLEVLLVHPGGPYWAGKDEGAWSIPKGEYGEDEDPSDAAKREFREETGIAVTGILKPLTPAQQAGGKIITAWAVEGDCDPSSVTSNTFMMEWPPKSGRQVAFPEVDRAAWFPAGVARVKINKGQTGFIDELGRMLGKETA